MDKARSTLINRCKKIIVQGKEKGFAVRCIERKKEETFFRRENKKMKLSSTSSDNPNGLDRFNTCSESAV